MNANAHLALAVVALVGLFNAVYSAGADGQLRNALGPKDNALQIDPSKGQKYTVQPAFPGDEPQVTGYRFNEFGPGQFGVERRGRKKFNYDIHQLPNGQYQLKKHRTSYSTGILGNVLQGALRAVMGIVPFTPEHKFPAAKYPDGQFAGPRAAFPYNAGGRDN